MENSSRDLYGKVLTIMQEKKTVTENLNSSCLDPMLSLYRLIESDLIQTLWNESDNFKKIKEWLIKRVEILSSYIITELKNWKESFMQIFIEEILKPNNNLEVLLTNPNEFLPDYLKVKSEDAVFAINEILLKAITKELKDWDTKYFDWLDKDTLNKILDRVNNLWCLDSETKEKLNYVISNCIFWLIAPEIKQYTTDFDKAVREAISKCDTTFNVKWYLDKFIEMVRNLENTQITRGSAADKLLQQCKEQFETEFDKSISELITKIAETKLQEEFENLDSLSDFEAYLKISWTTYSILKSRLETINDKDNREKLKNMLDEMERNAYMICKAKPPRVKITRDSAWNEYAHFKNEEFPVAKQKKVKRNRKIEPKELPNGHILITFRDKRTGNIVEPDMSKRLRMDNPYEVTREEYQEILRLMKDWNKISKEIDRLRKEIKETDDKQKKKELNEELLKYIGQLPFFMQVLDKLKILDNFGDDYIESKIPSFDPDTIKITPDIMENLREIAECSKTMLLWQKDALIIEWEAWVWKNVLIDIFAHYTHRPVFVFACWKKTDSHDLTYQWILDENGSKKLNSKVYEAIRTPWAILVFDEINTLDPWVIKMLNWLFDKRKTLVSPDEWGSDVKALPDVLLFGTMNPVGYAWTQELPQDVGSRFHHIYQEYDWLMSNDWVSYWDALRTYWNVNYFWKLLSWHGIRKKECELYEQALLDKKLWKKTLKEKEEAIKRWESVNDADYLSKEKDDILKRVKPISDAEFIRAWNIIFNNSWWDISEVQSKLWDKCIEGMQDIYKIVLISNYIRMKHKLARESIQCDDVWLDIIDQDSNELFESRSFSPRLQIQALEQLNNWNEIEDAKDAVIQTYIQQVPDRNVRDNLLKHFNNLSFDTIKRQLNDANVRNYLLKKRN